MTPLLLWLACTGETTTDSTSAPDDSGTTDTGQSACDPITGPGGDGALVPGLPPDTDVLVISIDTLRKDRVGRYHGSDTTPFLDAWLADSLVLEAHRSCSDWTAPSMLCFLTGTTPTEAGYEPHAGTDTVLVDVPEDLTGLTSWLAEAGHVPAVVTANAVLAEAQPASVDPRAIHLLDRKPAEDIVDTGLALLDSLLASGDPWFLHLHFNDPHSPYDPPESYLDGLDELAASPVDLTDEAAIVAVASDPSRLTAEEQALVAAHAELRYGGELRYLDDQLARLWSELEARGAVDQTLILMLSDHGEQFFEHGAFTHGTTLHAEEVDAIAAVRAPGLGAQAWTGPTAHQDLAATVVTALGLDAEGVTAPALGLAPPDRARHGFRQYRDVPPLHVLTRGDHRLLYSWEGDRSYYALDTDPHERSDRYDAEDPAVRCLWEFLAPWVDRAGTFMGDFQPADPGP